MSNVFELINEIKELTKDRDSFFTSTGTLIQDKQVYFNCIESYFKKVDFNKELNESVLKWIKILEELKIKLEQEKNIIR